MTRGIGRGVPADLPPAVARYQPSWGSATVTSLALLVVLGLYVGARALTGADWSGSTITLISIAGASALFMLLAQRRLVLAAGPGWLSSRDYVKTRWVRTDRLVGLSWSTGGVEQLLTLVDDEGRRVVITRTELSADAGVTDQVVADVRRSLTGGLQADHRALAVLGLDRGRLPRD